MPQQLRKAEEMWLLIDVNESKRITESSRGAVLGRVHEVAQIISPIEKNTKIKTKNFWEPTFMEMPPQFGGGPQVAPNSHPPATGTA